MITTTEQQKKSLKNYDKKIEELENSLKTLKEHMNVYITSILEGSEAKEDETYQKDVDYNFIKVKN